MGSTVVGIELRVWDDKAVDEGPERSVSRADDDSVSMVCDRPVRYDGVSEYTGDVGSGYVSTVIVPWKIDLF